MAANKTLLVPTPRYGIIGSAARQRPPHESCVVRPFEMHMQTADEAIAFFRSLSYPASLFDHPVAGAIRVSARQDRVGAEYYGEAIAVLRHTFVLFAEGQAWILRDCNWQQDIDERFDSLAEAVSALVEHFAEWAADGGKSVWLGRTKIYT